MSLSCTVSDIQRDIGRKSPSFTYPTCTECPVGVDPIGISQRSLTSENYRVPALRYRIDRPFSLRDSMLVVLVELPNSDL